MELVKEGLERFMKENGHMPTGPEIESCSYLPSARQLQRKFGGVKKVRAALGYEDTDFGRGSFRTQSSTKTTKRGTRAERDLEKYLIRHFGEIYVHTEKRYGLKGQRVDFVVFSPDGNLGIELFCTETRRDMAKNINVKVDKYLDFPKNLQLFFVVANDSFSQEEIDFFCRNLSKLKLIPSAKVLSLKRLYEVVSPMTFPHSQYHSQLESCIDCCEFPGCQTGQ
jgi:hypothetical protein